MDTFEELRNRMLFHRKKRDLTVNCQDLVIQIYAPKLPNDEVVFNIRRNIPGEEPDVTFIEHFATANISGCFWVYVNKEADRKVYMKVHEEFRMSEPLEKFKKVYREIFHDGRFDYIIDNLLSNCNSDYTD